MKELLFPFLEISKKPWFLLGNGILFFLLLNGIVSSGNCRKDLSKTGRFELTESSKKVFSDLDSILYIDAYYSSEIPGEYSSRLQITKGLLKEIESLGKGKIVLRFYDPDISKEDAGKAIEAGIEPQILQRTGRSSASVKQAYLGLALTLGNRNETIPLAFFPEQIEYQILTAFKKLNEPGRDSGIAVLKSEGNSGLSESGAPKDRMSLFFREVLTGEYGPISEIDPNKDSIPSGVDLIFWNSDLPVSETSIRKLDEYLANGGNLIVFPKTMEFQMQSPEAGFGLLTDDLGAGSVRSRKESEGMIRFLEYYGISIHSDIVLEPEDSLPMGALIEVEQGVFGRYPYPPWILARKQSGNLDPSSPYTQDQDSILLPWSSSLEILPGDRKKITYSILAKSSAEAESRGEPLSLGEKQLQAVPIRPNGGPFPLVVLAEGKFEPRTGGSIANESRNTGRILVVGSPYLVSDLLAYPDFREILKNSNIPFLLNSIDLMRGEEDLVKTRSKQSGILKMKELPFGWQTGIGLFHLFFFPVLLGLYAFRRLKSRRGNS